MNIRYKYYINVEFFYQPMLYHVSYFNHSGYLIHKYSTYNRFEVPAKYLFSNLTIKHSTKKLSSFRREIK